MRRVAAAGAIALLATGAAVALAVPHTTRGHGALRATTTAAARSCTPPSAGTHLVAVAQGRIPVVVHVPPHLAAGAPLVLGLPGANQTAKDFALYTGYSRLADAKGFAVAYPTATGTRPYWNISDAKGGPDDLAYLRAVIPRIVAYTCANPKRVGATGVSNGGGMAARLACDAADLVSAVAPVAGGYGSLPDCVPARPVPVLEIHGYEDEVVPYAGKGPAHSGAVSAFLRQWRRLDGCDGRAAVRTQPYANVTDLRWLGCLEGTRVDHDRVSDAEHGWPGEDDLSGRVTFSSTLRTWTFLSSFAR